MSFLRCAAAVLALVVADHGVAAYFGFDGGNPYGPKGYFEWDMFPLRTPTTVKQVTLGRAGQWIISSSNKVYYQEDSYDDPMIEFRPWKEVTGMKFKQLDSGEKYVWGIEEGSGLVKYRAGTDKNRVKKQGMFGRKTLPPYGLKWMGVPGSPKMASIAESGAENYLWGIGVDGDVYYKGNKKAFEKVDAPAKMAIVAGDDRVGTWVLDRQGNLYYRTPTVFNQWNDYDGKDMGKGWERIGDKKFKHISAGGKLFGLTPDNKLFSREADGSWKDRTPSGWTLKQFDSEGMKIIGVATDGKRYLAKYRL